MKHVKDIWVMGTCGFGRGNTTPVSEFNVYADAEAYKIMMDFGVHVNVGGYDLCTKEAAWFDEDTDKLLKSNKEAAIYAVKSNEMLAKFCYAIGGIRRIDLPDAVSLAPMLWPDVIKASSDCISYVCTENKETYGQVIFYDGRMLAAMGPGFDVKREVAVPILYNGHEIGGDLKMDLLVEDQVIIELKSVETLTDLHKKQLLSYLRLTGKKLGLLINFNSPSLDDKSVIRIIN